MPPQPQILFLNSADATQRGGTFSWSITDAYLQNFSNFSMQVLKMTIPNLVYPFGYGYNDYVYFIENGGGLTHTATIPKSNYTGTQFAAALQTAMNAVSANTYTVVYDAQSQILQVSITVGTFAFVGGDNNAYRQMGFTVDTPYAASLTGDNPVLLSGTDWISVIMDFPNRCYSSTPEAVGIAFRLPVTVSFGNVVFYEAHQPDMIETMASNLSQVVITLIDDQGHEWVLPDNARFSMTMQVQPFVDEFG